MSHALFAFAVSIFGFALAIRIADHLIARDFFDHHVMTKIGTTLFVCVIALSLTLPTSRTMIWFIVFSPLAIAAFALSLRVSRRASNFKIEVISALSIILLKMKSGRSFRQSLVETTHESTHHLREKLSEITSVVSFSQQKPRLIRDHFVRELVDEFILIDQQPHAAIRRLGVLREKLRTEDDFRRRSGQVLARLRAQSFVMSALYGAVAAFMIWKFGWRANANVLATSAFLFLIGLMWMLSGGRNLKWKV